MNKIKLWLLIMATLLTSLSLNANPFKELAIKIYKEKYNISDTSLLNGFANKRKEIYRKAPELKGFSEKTLDLLAWNAVFEFAGGGVLGWEDGWKFAAEVIGDSLIPKRDSIVFSNAYSFGWEAGYNAGYSSGLNRMRSNNDELLLLSLLNAMPRRYDIYLQLPQQLRIDFYYHPQTNAIGDIYERALNR
jgi:hypothetical protein